MSSAIAVLCGAVWSGLRKATFMSANRPIIRSVHSQSTMPLDSLFKEWLRSESNMFTEIINRG